MAGILFISAVAPYPADNGKKVVVSGMLEYLKERYGKERVRYLYLGESTPTDTQGTAYDSLPLPTGITKVWSVVKHSFITRKKSIQESILYSSTLRFQIHRYISEMNPDLIIFDTVRVGQFGYPAGFAGKSVLYMEDLFSVRYEKMLQEFSAVDSGYDFNTLGNFAKHVPGPLRFCLRYAGWLEKHLLRQETVLVRNSEFTMPMCFRTSLLLNEDEVDMLKSAVNADVKVIRPFIRMTSSASHRNYEGKPRFIFLGLLNLPYNEIGLLRFLQQGFSKILEECPDATLRIIGRNPTDQILAAVASFNGSVRLEGYVEDLGELLSTCCGMIVPVLFGSGVKIKVMEALAHGTPMVTTETGAMSIPLEHGLHCFIENDLSRFPYWMTSLLDVKRNRAISAHALEIFASLYSKNAVYASYDELFRI